MDADVLGKWLSAPKLPEMKIVLRRGESHDVGDELTAEGLQNIPVAVLVDTQALLAQTPFNWIRIGDYRFLSGNWLMMRSSLSDTGGFVTDNSTFVMIETLQGVPLSTGRKGEAINMQAMNDWMHSYKVKAVKPRLVSSISRTEIQLSWPTRKNPKAPYVHMISSAPKVPEPVVQPPPPPPSDTTKPVMIELLQTKDKLQTTLSELSKSRNETIFCNTRVEAMNTELSRIREQIVSLQDEKAILERNLHSVELLREEELDIRKKQSEELETSKRQNSDLEARLNSINRELAAVKATSQQLPNIRKELEDDKQIIQVLQNDLRRARADAARVLELEKYIPTKDQAFYTELGFTDQAAINELKRQSWKDLVRHGAETGRDALEKQGVIDQLQERLRMQEDSKDLCDIQLTSAKKYIADNAVIRTDYEQCRQALEENRQRMQDLQNSIESVKTSIYNEASEKCDARVDEERDRVERILNPELDKLRMANKKLEKSVIDVVTNTKKERAIWVQEYLNLAAKLGVEAYHKNKAT
jgi:chromosome segregation ATPase